MNFRILSEEDLPFLNSVRNKYAKKYLHDSRRFTIEDTIQWFKKNNPQYYIIEVNNEKAGYFRLSNYSKENRNIYIGADIDEKFKGMGIGYEAYKKFIPFLFNKYNLNKISLEVLSNNNIAINLYAKLGFVYEGEKREEVLKDGKYINSIMMSILKREYLKHKI